MAIDSINGFERSMLDAWSEVYDCWEREFITRLWRLEVEHHGGGTDGVISCPNNWWRLQEVPVTTVHDHIHTIPEGTIVTPANSAEDEELPTGVDIVVPPSESGDSFNLDTCDLIGHFTCPNHLTDLLKPLCVGYKVNHISYLATNYRPYVKELCEWMCAAVEAVGIKQAVVSAVMADPTLNGNCCNDKTLSLISELREKNHIILKKVEHAYGIYSDVENMKNKVDYDQQMALQELQPSKYSNEDQLNMASSVQTETAEDNLSAELCQGGISIKELKPWNHLELSDNKVEPKPIPVKCACNKFDKLVKSLAGFETMMVKD
jgi:hypothetical protein